MNESTESDDLEALENGLPVRRAKKMDTWSGRVTENIGEQLRLWRRKRKLTTQALSDSTAMLGQRVARSVITNLEHDRRDYVSVAELLVLAAALNVPPIVLIAPIGAVETVEALPEVEMSPWKVRGWMMGVLSPNHERLDLDEWIDGTAAIKLYDRHRLLVRAIQDTTKRLQELDDDRMEAFPGKTFPHRQLIARRDTRRLHLTQVTRFLTQLTAHRNAMEDLDLVLPELPHDIRVIVAELSEEAYSLFESDLSDGLNEP